MILAGTGHRPDKLGGYSLAASAQWTGVAEQLLQALQPERVISGMALGWDTYLARAAIRLGLPLMAAIPFNGQESRWPAESQHIYNRILDQATEVVVVCGGGYSAEKLQRRNAWMVDRCDFLLCCWDGSPGGTANCIAYARETWGTVGFEARHYNVIDHAGIDA